MDMVLVAVDNDGVKRLQHQGRDLPCHVCEESMFLRACMEMSAGQGARLPVCNDQFTTWINYAAAVDPQEPANAHESLQSLAAIFKV